MLPEFLDDGRHFFYVVMRGEESKRGVYVAALDSPQGRRVLGDESSVTYVPRAPVNRSGWCSSSAMTRCWRSVLTPPGSRWWERKCRLPGRCPAAIRLHRQRCPPV